jgi:hypothetical protein
MIAINDYRQFVSELVAAASQRSEVHADHVRLAVREKQLSVLLKDLPGVIVCGNIPGFELDYPAGFWLSSGECILYVLEKMPRDRQNTEEEFEAYARLQRLMAQIIRLLAGEDFQEFCDQGELDRSRPLVAEWEYNEYGGFNGLSVTFRLKDKNGPSL